MDDFLEIITRCWTIGLKLDVDRGNIYNYDGEIGRFLSYLIYRVEIV